MIGSITTVWTEILQWITTSLGQVQAIFYTAPVGDTPGSLTFLGVLAIVSVGIGLSLLFVGIVQNFLHLRS